MLEDMARREGKKIESFSYCPFDDNLIIAQTPLHFEFIEQKVVVM